MRRTLARITLTAAATAGLAATTYVQALGMGEINVSSDLNQRFLASIPLTEISSEDLETVTVSVAPNEAFDRAGIERAEYLSTLSFEIKNDGGRPRVIVTSSQIAREPVLDLLVQARWSGGKIVRDYTILLDPPATIAARPAVPVPSPVVTPRTPVPAPVIATAPPTVKPAAVKPNVPVGGEFYETPIETKPAQKVVASKVAPAVMDDAFDSATGSYGPVAPQQTLWNIATKVRPSAAVSMDQVMLALAEANPVAIQGGTTVSKGVILRVPSAERMQATPAAAAKTRLQAIRNGAPVTKIEAPKPTAQKPRELPDAPKPSPVSPSVTAAEPVRPALPKPEVALPPPAATTATAAVAPAAIPVEPKPSTPVIASAPPAPVPSAAETPAAEAVAAAIPPAAAPVAAPVKSPLAQPLAAPSSGFLADYGLPLGAAGLVALLGGAFLLWSRRRKQAEVKVLAQPQSGDGAGFASSQGSAGALAKLGDTTRVTETQTLGAATAAMAGTQQMTQPVQAVDAHQSTLILDPEAMATLNSAAQQSTVTNGEDRFDRTTQIQVDTLQINLGDNDPLSEAEFHLAYGLYDEAILLLKTAEQQQPQRTDLKVKLAETYFAAGRPMEFQETAEELKEKLSPGEWSKLAIMGAQICPDVALFQSADGDAGLDADFDLVFDEPEASAPAAGTIEFSLAEPVPEVAQSTSSELKLSLDEDYADDAKSASGIGALPPAGLDDEASIDFMLGQSLTPLGAGLQLPSASDLSFNLGSPSLNVPLPKVDITRSEEDPMMDMNDRPTLIPSGGGMFLQSLEVSITPRQPTVESSDDDDLNTKLDLARAYVEMGDNEMARSLLEEVQAQGGDRHQKEAASLLQRLPS